MVVGLTGKSCSGKDSFASQLPADKVTVIDMDGLGHVALENNHDKLRAAYGDSIFTADGKVDRKVLGPMVFSDPEKLETLNSITHPWMRQEALRQAREAEKEGKVAVINAALLESMDCVGICDQVILILAPFEQRAQRAYERNGTSREQFKQRSEAQMDLGLSLFKSGKKVIVIVNDEGRESLSRQVRFWCDTIL